MIGRFSNLGTYKDLLNWKDFFKAGVAGLLALIGWLIDHGSGEHSTMGLVLILGSVGINGVPIIWGAISGLLERKVNVDELVSLAIIASLVSGEFLSAAIVSFVMVVGALIEEATGESARRAIRALIRITPKNATLVTEHGEVVKSVDRIRVGDVLVIKPGERVPVDGEVISGQSAVDESSITGEPIPCEKLEGHPVFSGTLNQSGVLRIRATRVGKDSTLGKVIQLVSDAEAHKPQSVALIDRYARWFTPFILACAAVAWGLTGELSRGVTVLIVGCPCALILAAPTAIVATISRAARSGVLIKGGHYIERVGAARAVLFDKTGTLTRGEPQVNCVVPAAGQTEKHVLTQAACAEAGSSHPLARAVLSAADMDGISVNGAENHQTRVGDGVSACVNGRSVAVGRSGMNGSPSSLDPALEAAMAGLKEEGATPLVVFEAEKAIGIISVTDQVRPDAPDAIEELKATGMTTVGILSGDHAQAVERVGRQVGASETWARLKPKDKLEIIRNFQAAEERTIYVGDGINDAPALAASDVGIAMGAKGTDVALETADIALMNDDLSRLPFLIKLSRRMVRTIKVNIAFGLGFNLISVLAGGSGLLSPVMGALVHNIGSVIVVLSSASIAFVDDWKPSASRYSQCPATVGNCPSPVTSPASD